MSNYLAMATVTATLSRLVQEAANLAVPGATVTTVPPEKRGQGTPSPVINIYLFQAVPNTTWRNADLPVRRSDGTLTQRPQAAVDLHYLLTCYGNDATLEPQRLMGAAISALHAHPVLTREMIRAAVLANPFLAGSDLAEQVETVKFAPLPIDLEELSKLWSVFFQTPYALSVTYQASVVFIEGKETAQEALPVRKRQLYVMPLQQPVVEAVQSQEGPDQPISASSTLLIRGQRLRGEVTLVRIGEIEVEVDPARVKETEIVLALAPLHLAGGRLRAGVQGLQVVHRIMMGDPPAPHRGVESNVAAFVLRPTIDAITVSNLHDEGDDLRSADIELELSPSVGQQQRVTLLLNEFDAPSTRSPRAYRFDAPARDQPGDPPASPILTIPITRVGVGSYLLRVQVDGAEPPLIVDPDEHSPTYQQYIGPRVSIP